MSFKKLISIFVMSIILSTAVFADDKGSVKVGPFAYSSISGRGTDSVTAAVSGSNYVIAIGGVKVVGRGAITGVTSVYFSTAELENFTKGYTLDVSAPGNEVDEASSIVFLVGKSTVKGTTATTVSYATDDETMFDGTFKVVAYNASTKELKFMVTGKATNTLKSTTVGTKVDSSTEAKALPVIVKGVVTLP